MLHLTWKILQNRNLQSALDKIRHSTKIEFESAYRAGRVTERVGSEQNKAHETNIELLKKYAKKDDRGHIIPIPNCDDFEFEPQNKEKYVTELKALADTEFVVKAEKIDYLTIKACELTTAEIIALVDAGIISEPS